MERTIVEISKQDNKNVHLYLWFTNLPELDEEESSRTKDPSGVTQLSVVCTPKKTVLIRGPDRDDLETAGVSERSSIVT